MDICSTIIQTHTRRHKHTHRHTLTNTKTEVEIYIKKRVKRISKILFFLVDNVIDSVFLTFVSEKLD